MRKSNNVISLKRKKFDKRRKKFDKKYRAILKKHKYIAIIIGISIVLAIMSAIGK